MACVPPSSESIEALRQLRRDTAERGEECLSALLAGIDLYVSLGKEMEILEMLRDYADSLRESVENTPSPQDLERLYENGKPNEDAPGPPTES